tara:strand:- start:109 stop:318 length:210 start_codon:yes stop_codon:yes gene_type:complete
MKKYVMIEKKTDDPENLTLAKVNVLVLGCFNTRNEVASQLKMMDNLQKAGRLDPKMSIDILEVDFDGEA